MAKGDLQPTLLSSISSNKKGDRIIMNDLTNKCLKLTVLDNSTILTMKLHPLPSAGRILKGILLESENELVYLTQNDMNLSIYLIYGKFTKEGEFQKLYSAIFIAATWTTEVPIINAEMIDERNIFVAFPEQNLLLTCVYNVNENDAIEYKINSIQLNKSFSPIIIIRKEIEIFFGILHSDKIFIIYKIDNLESISETVRVELYPQVEGILWLPGTYDILLTARTNRLDAESTTLCNENYIFLAKWIKRNIIYKNVFPLKSATSFIIGCWCAAEKENIFIWNPLSSEILNLKLCLNT